MRLSGDALPDHGMHPARDPEDFTYPRRAGGRVTPGVSWLPGQTRSVFCL